MLIIVIYQLIYNLFGILFNDLYLPTAPNDVYTYIDNFFNMITQNLQFVNWFIPLNYCFQLALLSIAITLLVNGYFVILWIVRKIPILNIH